MENFTKTKELGSSDATPQKPQESLMDKPQIHTTECGTQYVNVVDVVRSKAGWAEIQRLKEANLVRDPSSANGANKLHNPHDK